MKKYIGLVIVLVFPSFIYISRILAEKQIPVTAPMTTDLAGSSGSIAGPSVFRIVCPTVNRSGTGFPFLLKQLRSEIQHFPYSV